MAQNLAAHRTTYTPHTQAQLATAATNFSGLTVATGTITNLENESDATTYPKPVIEAVVLYMQTQVNKTLGYSRAMVIDDIRGLRAKVQ